MTTSVARRIGITTKYLKRDGDPHMTWPQLAKRELGECASQVSAAHRLYGRQGWRLGMWMVAYHAGMFVRPFATRKVRCTPVKIAGRSVRVFFRQNQSDLYILRENLISRIYDHPIFDEGLEVSTIVDLGANAGLSALFFQAKFPQASIVCVEPVSGNLDMLALNRDGNGFTWTLLKAAAGGSSGEVALYPNEWWSSSTTTPHVAEARQRNSGRLEKQYALPPETVECLTMADILDRNGIGVVDILKMDVEGAEEAIFKADLSWLDRTKLLILEIHDKYVDREFIEERLAEAGLVKQVGRQGPTDAFVNRRWA